MHLHNEKHWWLLVLFDDKIYILDGRLKDKTIREKQNSHIRCLLQSLKLNVTEKKWFPINCWDQFDTFSSGSNLLFYCYVFLYHPKPLEFDFSEQYLHQISVRIRHWLVASIRSINNGIQPIIVAPDWKLWLKMETKHMPNVLCRIPYTPDVPYATNVFQLFLSIPEFLKILEKSGTN